MSDTIILRALTMDDAKISWKWRNDPEMLEFHSGHPFPVSYEIEKNWYEKSIYSNIPTSVFGIETTETKKLIGMTLLKKINLVNRESEFAIFIGDKEERGKGHAKEATLKTLAFAFYNLGLNRVFLMVTDDNLPAIKLYEKCSFIKEGILRKSIFKNNTFKDQIVMSILAEEFKEKQTS